MARAVRTGAPGPITHEDLISAVHAPAAHCLEVRALLALGLPRDAARAAWAAVAEAPDWAYAHRLLSMALHAQAHHERRPPLLRQAVSHAQEAVRLLPTDAANCLALAEARSADKDHKCADDAVQAAIRLAPQQAATWVTASYVALRAPYL